MPALTERERRALLYRVEQAERQLAQTNPVFQALLDWCDGAPPSFGLDDDGMHELIRRLEKQARERRLGI